MLPRSPPPGRLDVVLFADLFNRSASIDGTGKRKADGEYADTRLGKPATLKWAHERFRQVMMLIREFRSNWPSGQILSNADVEFIRVCLDVALCQAIKLGHTGDPYDMSPTVWAMWMVQHALATRTGGWQVESIEQQRRWSLAEMYRFLQAMHARGDTLIIRDPVTRERTHRFKLPFKTMIVPPKDRDLFKWKKGARRLSDWMVAGGLAPLNPGIIQQQVPTIVPLPPLASRRSERATAMWRRVGQQAGQYQLQSVAQDDDDGSAQETRLVVGGVMAESRAAAAEQDAEWGAAFEDAFDDTPDDGEQQGIPVTAERVGPPLEPQQQDRGPLAQGQLVWHISQLLNEMHERGDAPMLGELSPARQRVLDELRDELMSEPSSGGAGPSGAGPSGPSSAGAASSSSSAPPPQPAAAAGPSGSQPSQHDDEAGLSEYERQRKRNIARNQRVLEELGLGGGSGTMPATEPRGGGGRRRTPMASGPTAPSRRSTRDRGSTAPSYADAMNSGSDDTDEEYDEEAVEDDDDDDDER